MKVEVKLNDNSVNFSNMREGDAFWHCGYLCMKTDAGRMLGFGVASDKCVPVWPANDVKVIAGDGSPPYDSEPTPLIGAREIPYPAF